MAVLTIDTGKKTGRIKPLHGGGQPPIGGRGTDDFTVLAEAGIPYSRLHDCGGCFGDGLYVDVPNIFRDFDADENDPASYDFVMTDRLLEALVRCGVEPYYRLGVTIENHAGAISYRIDPPRDFGKWARICEHIMAHYLRGWAGGYHFPITYWEIWNEPENNGVGPKYTNEMWTGTDEDYFRLYEVASKHLKARFPEARVGGYSSCGFYYLTETPERREHRLARGNHGPEHFMSFFKNFFAYVKEHDCPIDFFSWHSYACTRDTEVWADFVADELEKAGFAGLPTHINEWNPCPGERGTAHHGAEVAAMMLAMQNKKCVDLMCIYDMRSSGTYSALFDSMKDIPTYGYYAMAAFNELYRLGTQVELSCDTPGIYAVAATDRDGGKHAVMVSNLTGHEQSLTFSGIGLTGAKYWIMDENRLMSWAANAGRLPKNGVALIEF